MADLRQPGGGADDGGAAAPFQRRVEGNAGGVRQATKRRVGEQAVLLIMSGGKDQRRRIGQHAFKRQDLRLAQPALGAEAGEAGAGEEILYADVDPAAVTELRRVFPVLTDRRL